MHQIRSYPLTPKHMSERQTKKMGDAFFILFGGNLPFFDISTANGEGKEDTMTQLHVKR